MSIPNSKKFSMTRRLGLVAGVALFLFGLALGILGTKLMQAPKIAYWQYDSASLRADTLGVATNIAILLRLGEYERALTISEFLIDLHGEGLVTAGYGEGMTSSPAAEKLLQQRSVRKAAVYRNHFGHSGEPPKPHPWNSRIAVKNVESLYADDRAFEKLLLGQQGEGTEPLKPSDPPEKQ